MKAGGMESMLGNGVYSFPEAAALTQLPTKRVRGWFADAGGGGNPRRGVFRSDYGREGAISFLDLIEVLVAGNLREQGVSLQAIRKVHNILGAELGTGHPFSHEMLFTDGQRVFLSKAKDAREEQMIEILSRQHVFPRVLLPYLKQVSYDDATQLARLWAPFEGIVIDPARRFGKPIVASCGIAVRILVSAYRANGRDAERVAAWYGITTEEVLSAVGYETEYLREAA